MNCISPLSIRVKRHSYYTYFEHYKVPCGHCLNCMISKQSALEFLAKKELYDVYRTGRGASFITLTYDDEHIPRNDDNLVTLRKHDVQCWLKNVRRQMEYHNKKIPFKYIMCGEYGDDFGRPHYHIVFLGLTDAQVVDYSRKLWKNGLCDIGVLGQGGLRYICKYMTKQNPSKDVKDMRKALNVENPFICHSFGLGKKWIQENCEKIADNDFQFEINGKTQFFPKYVCQYVSSRTGKSYKKVFNNYNMKRLNKDSSKTLSEIDEENAYIKWCNNVNCLRSKGISLSPEELSKRHWIKPKHFLDRKIENDKAHKLAIKAFYADKDYRKYGDVVPF